MESIKVHCIVSCLSEILRRNSQEDFRPLYFGVWDAPYGVTEDGEFTYYTEHLNHYLEWFNHLYGSKVMNWYDPAVNREQNLQSLLKLVESDEKNKHIVVQIDMSFMPERENKFSQKPFPHYLIVKKTDVEDEWYMLDPDFRWEGVVNRKQVIEAFMGNPFGGGFYVDSSSIRRPAKEMVERYFWEGFKRDNSLTNHLIEGITNMVEERNGYRFEMLFKAVRQLPVIAIRKYGYEHALMYLNQQEEYSRGEFEFWCHQIEALVKGFHQVQYKVMKMSMTKQRELLPSVIDTLIEMDQIEHQIKGELEKQFNHWKKGERL